jgi:chromosome segregation ATPase
MLKFTRAFLAAALAIALAAFMAGTVLAQSKGKIICWKDKSGKVVGCGDKVPPEFEDSATKELDRRGVTRKTTDTAEEQAKRAAQDEAMAKQKAEEKKRLAEQKRQDSALLNTYANEKEIDQRRDREVQVVEAQITQLRALHTNAETRHNDLKSRIEAVEKAKKKPPSDLLKEEAAHAAADMAKLEQGIASKNKEIVDIRARYAQTKQRYMAIQSGGAQSAAAPAAPAAATK